MFSWTMHLDIKDELLFAILFFGFRRLPASLLGPKSIALPSPKAGADPRDRRGLLLPERDVPASLLGATSADDRPSFGFSCMLAWIPDRTVLFVLTLNREGGSARELNDRRDTLVPPVAG
jgi:hypothetical protein